MMKPLYNRQQMQKTTQSPYDKIKLDVINAHREVAKQFEAYYYKKLRCGGTPQTHKLSSSILGVFYLIASSMRNEPGRILPDKLKIMFMSHDEAKINEAWEVIDDWLYDKKFTKVDNIPFVDMNDWEEDNKANVR